MSDEITLETGGMHDITLESGRYGWDYFIVHDDGREILIQSDWDYPATASTFGWSSACNYNEDGEYDGGGCGTDGTVDCGPGCRKPHTATEHIQNAGDFLDEHIGARASDPGYFD